MKANNDIVKTTKRIVIVASLTLLAATIDALSQQQTLVYTNHFESVAGSEWSRRNISTTPIGTRRFLGEFGNEAISLLVTQLPPHNLIAVGFDLYVIRSWDGSGPIEEQNGPDIFRVREAQTNTLVQTTFASHEYFVDQTNIFYRMQSYPGEFPQSVYPWSTGCREANTLGYSWEWPQTIVPRYNADSVYPIAKAFSHASNSLRLTFSKESLSGNNTLTDESWGLDNIFILAMTLPEQHLPVILAEPQSTRLSQDGDGTAFSVTAASISPMTYQWYRGASPILGGTNSFLAITNLSSESLGGYRVLIANAHGITLSQVAELSVKPPAIRRGPTNFTAFSGATNASFSIQALGAGTLHYQWMHNSIALSNSPTVIGTTSPILHLISGLTESDAGEYRCIVQNFAGMTTNVSASLTVLSTPRPALELVQSNGSVTPAFSGLLVGTVYQLQISTDLSTWTNYGVPFTAISLTMIHPDYFDVSKRDSLYFRLQSSP